MNIYIYNKEYSYIIDLVCRVADSQEYTVQYHRDASNALGGIEPEQLKVAMKVKPRVISPLCRSNISYNV